MEKIIKQRWYQNLLHDLRKLEYTGIVLTKWNVGKRICAEEERHEYGKNIVKNLAEDLGCSTGELWSCIKFYKKYSDGVRELEDKSWRYIEHNLLYESKTKEFELKPLPRGRYQVIYADPPWDIESMVLDKWESPLSDKYPTMSLEELKRMNIQELQAENCVCFMWTTHTKLEDALELLKYWGFQYHCLLTWDKGNGWSVAGFHRRTEFVLIGYKGKLSSVIKQEGAYIPTLFYEKKTTHSTKPQIVYNLIEDRTVGKRVELFARNTREGWDSWGNQLWESKKKE